MKEKILIVEDNPSILTGLVDLLSGEGYIVFSSIDGNRALSIYNMEKPDLLLLDIMIPEKSGYEVCKEIRKKNPQIPIIMLTAKGQEVDKVVGLEITITVRSAISSYTPYGESIRVVRCIRIYSFKPSGRI